LRRGVTWHTGREFTSDDVQWNFIRARDPKLGAGEFAAQSAWFTTIETPDKNTIVLKSEQPRPSMFDMFQAFNLVDRTVIEGTNTQLRASGTGPFRFVEWAQGQSISIARNKDYWQSGRPYLDGIEISVRAGDQPGLLALEAGSIDLLRTAAIQELERLRADPNLQVLLHPSSGSYYELAFLTRVPPFDNKLVRQAFNWAIDRQRLATQVFHGFAQPINLQWYPSSPAYDAAKNSTYTFNLDKARDLLKQANVSSLETDVIILSVNPLNSLGFLQIYQADLAKLNVKLNIKTYDGASWSAAVLSNNYNAMYGTNDVVSHLHPINNLNGPTWRPVPNNTRWDPPEWKAMFNDIATETDATKQKALFERMNSYILDESWAMPMCTDPQVLVGTKRLKGVTVNQYGAWYFTDAWLE
jgi:peptide/nickel transport system substrate-binding protein